MQWPLLNRCLPAPERGKYWSLLPVTPCRPSAPQASLDTVSVTDSLSWANYITSTSRWGGGHPRGGRGQGIQREVLCLPLGVATWRCPGCSLPAYSRGHHPSCQEISPFGAIAGEKKRGSVLKPGKGAREAPMLGQPPGTHQAQVWPYP